MIFESSSTWNRWRWFIFTAKFIKHLFIRIKEILSFIIKLYWQNWTETYWENIIVVILFDCICVYNAYLFIYFRDMNRQTVYVATWCTYTVCALAYGCMSLWGNYPISAARPSLLPALPLPKCSVEYICIKYWHNIFLLNASWLAQTMHNSLLVHSNSIYGHQHTLFSLSLSLSHSFIYCMAQMHLAQLQ